MAVRRSAVHKNVYVLSYLPITIYLLIMFASHSPSHILESTKGIEIKLGTLGTLANNHKPTLTST